LEFEPTESPRPLQLLSKEALEAELRLRLFFRYSTLDEEGMQLLPLFLRYSTDANAFMYDGALVLRHESGGAGMSKDDDSVAAEAIVVEGLVVAVATVATTAAIAAEVVATAAPEAANVEGAAEYMVFMLPGGRLARKPRLEASSAARGDSEG
jgi:hypothetical protein